MGNIFAKEIMGIQYMRLKVGTAYRQNQASIKIDSALCCPGMFCKTEN